MTKAFEDTSIFQGWTQYQDEEGVEWRREDFKDYYNFFKADGDTFIFHGTEGRVRSDPNDNGFIHRLYVGRTQA